MNRFLLTLLLTTTIIFGTMAWNSGRREIETNVIAADAEKTPRTETSEQTPRSAQSPTLDRLTKGDELFALGHFPLAEIEYRVATELEPMLSESWAKLGQTFFHEKKYAEAVAALTKARTLNPSNPPDAEALTIAQTLGKTYLAQEQFEAANELFKSLPPDQQAQTSTLYYQGTFAAFFNDLATSETALNQVVERGDDPELSKKATNLLASLTEYRLAEDASPAYLKTLLARSLAENEEISMAIALVYDVLRDEPDYRDAWIILGYAYLTQDKFKEAQEALFKAVELDPVKAESRYFLGLSYFGLDDYGSAVTQLELAIKGGFEPKVQAYQKLGDAAVLAKNYPVAADAYEKVLAINSSDVGLYVRPVWLYLDQLNKPERALELGQTALKNHPNSAMAYNVLGWAQIGNQQYGEAEQNLNSALTLDPNLAAAHLNTGRLFEARGDMEKAKEGYKRAYTLEPESSIGQLAAERYNALTQTQTPNPTP